jgi:integrase
LPNLTRVETRELLDSIETDASGGLRDRALIGKLVYSFARIGAALAMKIDDYFLEGKRWKLRLHEKGGKEHVVPVHHTLEEYLDAYLEATDLRGQPKGPLFRSLALGLGRPLSERSLAQSEAWRMIRRRAATAGIKTKIGCHTFRATGITTYLENGGTLEHARQIAAHESPRPAKLYDRTTDQVSLDEIERIAI